VPRDPADVLDRVRKLLALAGSPNVHEAASAAGKAQALIERHRLEALLDAEAADVADPVTDGREAPLEVARRLRPWKVVLASGLAEANGCLAYTADHGDVSLLLVAGRAGDREVVAALYEGLVRQLEWLSATHGAGRSRDWHTSFRIGAAEVVVGRLGEATSEVDATLSEAALVLVQPARVARAHAVDAFAEQHLGLRAGRSLRVDGRGLQRGREVGATMPLPARS
jgi:hypothetical protein